MIKPEDAAHLYLLAAVLDKEQNEGKWKGSESREVQHDLRRIADHLSKQYIWTAEVLLDFVPKHGPKFFGSLALAKQVCEEHNTRKKGSPLNWEDDEEGGSSAIDNYVEYSIERHKVPQSYSEFSEM